MLSGGRSAPQMAAAAILVLGLAGCGGGGGGTASTASAVDPPPSPTPAPTPAANPAAGLGFVIAPASTEETLSANALGPINAFVPIDRYGIRGQNQAVAVFDAGVDAGNPDLAGQILASQGFNEGSDTPETIATDSDSESHGTAVSSIIAGAIGPNLSVEGVAPSAQIVPVQLSENRSGDFDRIDDTHLAPAVAYVSGLGNVHVINNSWNFVGLSIGQYEQRLGHQLAADFPNTVQAWQSFVNQGNVVVWAAGNESAPEPDAFAALPQEVRSLQPGWAVAVAITPSGALASYSNSCGATAAYCLAAVGGPVSVAVSSAVSATGYVLSSAPNGYIGTSFAAPAVTGAIALLMSAAPNITAQQALQILFLTANKSGAYAQSAVYGQGVIDLNAAMQPVGEPVVAAQGIASAPLAATALTLGGAFGAGPMRALAATPLTVQDSFARGFVVPLGSRLGPAAPSFDAPDRVALFGQPDRTLFDDGISQFALVQSADPRIESPDRSGLRFVARERLGGAVTLRAAAGIDPARLLPSGNEGAAASLAGDLLAPGAMANPYLALIDKPLAAGAEIHFGATRVAMVSAVGEPILPAGLTDQPGAPLPRIFASDVEAERRLGPAALLRLDAGAMIESDTLLGTYGSGAARMSRSETWFAGVGGEWQADQNTTFAAGIHAGLSDAAGGPGSMVESAAHIASFAAGIGVVRHDWLLPGAKLTLGVALPLRAVSGHADLLVPTSVNLDGSVTPRPVRVGMNADGSELDLQAAWAVPVDERTRVTSGLLLRKDPDNISGAPLEAVAAVRLDLRF